MPLTGKFGLKGKLIISNINSSGKGGFKVG
jgi:hypothetical protein